MFNLLKVALIFITFTGHLSANTMQYDSATLSQIESITYYTEKVPTISYLENNKPAGASVDILKLMWDNMGVKHQPIYITAWPRAYHNTLNTPNSAIFTTIRTKNREELFKWVGPLYASSLIVLARTDFNHKLNSLEDIFNYKTVAARNSATLEQLSEVNQKIEKVTFIEQGIRMLERKRVDLLLTFQGTWIKLIKQNQLAADDFQIVLEQDTRKAYFAFNINTPDAIIEKFQTSFDLILPERVEIMRKYNLLIPETMTQDVRDFLNTSSTVKSSVK